MSLVENLEKLFEEECPHCGKETTIPPEVTAPEHGDVTKMSFLELDKVRKSKSGTEAATAAHAEMAKRVQDLKKLPLNQLLKLQGKYGNTPEIAKHIGHAIVWRSDKIRAGLKQQSTEQLASLAQKYKNDPYSMKLIQFEMNSRKVEGQ